MLSLQRRRKRMAFFMVLPLLILFIGITMYPFAYMIYISFHDYSLVSFEPPQFIGFQNYRNIYSDLTARSSVNFTIFLLIVAVPIEIFFGLGIAFLLRDVFGERAFRGFLLIPMMIPPVVAGIAWKMLFNFEFGPINYFLSLLGYSKVSWLGSHIFLVWG